MYACGLNTAGQLGLGTNVTSTNIPTKLTFPAGTVITKLVAGLDRAHAIASNGKVYGWGYNFNGELGLGYRSTNSPYAVATPTEVPALFGSKEIAGGAYQTFALDEFGTLLATGLNEGGQLGVGSTDTVTGDPAPTKQDGKVDQNLIFTLPAGPYVTGTLTNLTALSLSTNGSPTGLVPVFSSLDPAVAIVESNNLIRFQWWGGTNTSGTNSVRTVRITATQPGSTNYNAAVPVVREVTVVRDTTVPVITLNGDATVSLYVDDVYIDPGATALDPVDGILTGNIFVTGTVNTAVIGSYVLTYQVLDAAGNLGQATRTVNIVEP